MAKTRILVVDDELIGRQLLQAVLLPEGFDVELAENGEEAIELALIKAPDLVLMDVMMHGMDGYETVRKMKSHDVLEKIPVIMVTALEDRDSRIRGLQSGAVDYITKPFDRIEVVNKIKNRTLDLSTEIDNGKSISTTKTGVQNSILNSLVQEILNPGKAPTNFTGKIEFLVEKGAGEYKVGQWTHTHGQTEYLCLFGPAKSLEQTIYQSCLISMWLRNNAKEISSSPEGISNFIQSRINSSAFFNMKEASWWFLVFEKSTSDEIKSSGFNRPPLVLWNKNFSEDPSIFNALRDQPFSFHKECDVLILSRDILEQLNDKKIVNKVKHQVNNPETATFTSIVESLIENTSPEEAFGIKLSF